jgi:CBS domain-containing protein
MAARTAEDIMTREVVTIPVSATLREAARLLVDKNISGAPVADAQGKVVGVLTEGDILDEDRRTAAIPRISTLGFFLASEADLKRAYDDGLALPVEKLMTRRVLSAAPHEPITELMRLMVTRRINRIPIMDGNKLVGIVTRSDILRGLLDSME